MTSGPVPSIRRLADGRRVVDLYRGLREIRHGPTGTRIDLDPQWRFAPISRSEASNSNGLWVRVEHAAEVPTLVVTVPPLARVEPCSPSADAGGWWLRTAEGGAYGPALVAGRARSGAGGFGVVVLDQAGAREPEPEPKAAAEPWVYRSVIGYTTDGRAIRRYAPGWIKPDGTRGYSRVDDLARLERQGRDWADEPGDGPERRPRREPATADATQGLLF